MLQKNGVLVGVIVLIGLSGCAGPDKSRLEEKDTSLPGAAAAAIQTNFPNTQITDVIMEREQLYEVF